MPRNKAPPQLAAAGDGVGRARKLVGLLLEAARPAV